MLKYQVVGDALSNSNSLAIFIIDAILEFA